MLVLSRKKGESIVISDDVTVTVVEIRGDIKDDKVNHWQVTIKVGFTLD